MKALRFSATAVAVGLGLGWLNAGTASADLFEDANGAEFSNNAHLNIDSVEVTNDATDITFKVNLVGNPAAPDWGKYMIGIDSVPGGDTNGNPWVRPIRMSGGMDYWVGSWADFGTGAEVYRFGQEGWGRVHASYDPTN